MRKELLTLAVACLLCVPAFAADDEEPKGVSNIKDINLGKIFHVLGARQMRLQKLSMESRGS